MKTTLEELVGKDGQLNVWLVDKNGYTRQRWVDITVGGTLRISGYELKELADFGTRWCHSPFTKYEDANKFIV